MHRQIDLDHPPYPKKKNIMRNLLFPKRSWTEEEDELLTRVVEKHGPHRWSFIARYLSNRMGKQCRERWFNHLDPSISKQKWSEEEEWKLFLGHELMGSRWAKLSKIITGRTDNGIKNHWNSIMKKKLPDFQERLEMLLTKQTYRNRQKEKIINQLLNVDEEQLKDEPQSESLIKSEKVELTEPTTLLIQKKSDESDQLSFDHILKKLDQNDELNMQKTQSYNYDCALHESNRIKKLSSNENQKGQRQSNKMPVGKQNLIKEMEELDFLQQIDNIPLPPLLHHRSSVDCRSKLISSPFKQL